MSEANATLYIGKENMKKYIAAADALYKVDCNVSKILGLILDDMITAAEKIQAENEDNNDCKNYRDYNWKLTARAKE